jgi:hypothetical protein
MGIKNIYRIGLGIWVDQLDVAIGYKVFCMERLKMRHDEEKWIA